MTTSMTMLFAWLDFVFFHCPERDFWMERRDGKGSVVEERAPEKAWRKLKWSALFWSNFRYLLFSSHLNIPASRLLTSWKENWLEYSNLLHPSVRPRYLSPSQFSQRHPPQKHKNVSQPRYHLLRSPPPSSLAPESRDRFLCSTTLCSSPYRLGGRL
jgi:hypothetical protein